MSHIIDPKKLPRESVVIIRYERFIGLMMVIIALVYPFLYVGYTMITRSERRIINKLDNLGLTVFDGAEVKTVRIGNEGHVIIRRYVKVALKQLYNYSGEDYQDSINAGKILLVPKLAREHETEILAEVDSLRNLGGYYRIRFIRKFSIPPMKGGESGDWKVRLQIHRVYRNEFKKRIVQKYSIDLVVSDSNEFAVSKIDENYQIRDEIGLVISQLTRKKI